MPALSKEEQQNLVAMLEFRQLGTNPRAFWRHLLRLTAIQYLLLTVFVFTAVIGFALFEQWITCALIGGMWLGAVLRQFAYIRYYIRLWPFQSNFMDWPKVEAALKNYEGHEATRS